MDEILRKAGLNPQDSFERNQELLYIKLDECENNLQNVTDDRIIQELKAEQSLLEEALETLTRHKHELDTALVVTETASDGEERPASYAETNTSPISEVELAIERMIAQAKEKNEKNASQQSASNVGEKETQEQRERSERERREAEQSERERREIEQNESEQKKREREEKKQKEQRERELSEKAEEDREREARMRAEYLAAVNDQKEKEKKEAERQAAIELEQMKKKAEEQEKANREEHEKAVSQEKETPEKTVSDSSRAAGQNQAANNLKQGLTDFTEELRLNDQIKAEKEKAQKLDKRIASFGSTKNKIISISIFIINVLLGIICVKGDFVRHFIPMIDFSYFKELLSGFNVISVFDQTKQLLMDPKYFFEYQNGMSFMLFCYYLGCILWFVHFKMYGKNKRKILLPYYIIYVVAMTGYTFYLYYTREWFYGTIDVINFFVTHMCVYAAQVFMPLGLIILIIAHILHGILNSL